MVHDDVLQHSWPALPDLAQCNMLIMLLLAECWVKCITIVYFDWFLWPATWPTATWCSSYTDIASYFWLLFKANKNLLLVNNWGMQLQLDDDLRIHVVTGHQGCMLIDFSGRGLGINTCHSH